VKCLPSQGRIFAERREALEGSLERCLRGQARQAGGVQDHSGLAEPSS
jgi:hypothetical protein